ncbi:MAG: hypothetical protein H6581_27825 [Bacteroidia bacterium]|nr:hypothetical protein [Bacteroidia bacterium]
MKFNKLIPLVLLLAGIFSQVSPLLAQAPDFKSAVGYLGYIDDQYSVAREAEWQYALQIAHGKKPRKIEKTRLEVLNSITNMQKNVAKMPAFEGSTAFRDSVVKYLKINYAIMNQDYAEIVNMEEIAEQSYDNMEAFILAKEEAGKKMESTFERMIREQEKFCEANNVRLTDPVETEDFKNKKIAGEVFSQYNEIYLIFFKSYKQYGYLQNAIQEGDVSAMEQNANALSNYSKEGKEKLTKVSNFNGDRSLAGATREVLDFYQNFAEKTYPQVIASFFELKDTHTKLEKAFNNKKEKDRTQADVDEINGSVAKLNAAAATYNSENQNSYNKHSALLDDYNKKAAKFLDNNVPKK